MGDYERALYYCKQAISLDSTDTDYIFYKANIEDNAGNTKDAIATMDCFLQKNQTKDMGTIVGDGSRIIQVTLMEQ